MAERGAHMSTVPQARPTVFEVIAQESLMNTLNPALKTLIEVLVRKNPSKLHWLLKWYDELFLGVSGVLQHYYLKHFEASFSEAFYGLRRVPSNGTHSLSRRHKVMSMVYLVGFPYLAGKLDDFVALLEEESTGGDGRSKRYEKLLSLLKSLTMAYGTVKLIQIVAYMMGKAKSHSPLLKLAGVSLTYQSEEVRAGFTWTEIYNIVFKRKTVTGSTAVSVLVHLLVNSLELSAFFIQFLRWWHSDELKQQLQQSPTPEAPALDSSKADAQLCPVCQRPRKITVALQTSGYLFCYKCIKEVLTATGKCPVTYIPSNINDLVRVY